MGNSLAYFEYTKVLLALMLAVQKTVRSLTLLPIFWQMALQFGTGTPFSNVGDNVGLSQGRVLEGLHYVVSRR